MIPFNSQDPKRNFVNWVAFSDDAGKTWKRGAEVPQEGMQLNEVQVAEAADGVGLPQLPPLERARRCARPRGRTDGGATWTKAVDDAALPEPTCQGSLLAAKHAGKPAIFFLNPGRQGPGQRHPAPLRRRRQDVGRIHPPLPGSRSPTARWPRSAPTSACSTSRTATRSSSTAPSPAPDLEGR